MHSTAGYEQVIPRLQLACDSSGFVFQKVSQILVCFLIFGTLTDSIEYVVLCTLYKHLTLLEIGFDLWLRKFIFSNPIFTSLICST